MPNINTTPHIEDWPNGSDPDDISRKSDADRTDRLETILQPGLVQVDYGVEPEPQA